MRPLVAATVFALACALRPLPAAADPNGSCPSFAAPVGAAETGMLVLLKDLPIGTKWAELPAATKTKLQSLADDRLAAYRAGWSANALEQKLTILRQCPTREMTAAIDQYYRTSYRVILPPAFTLRDIKNTALVDALVGNYLGVYAAQRASLTYFPDGILPNLDWDGKSLFDSIRLPDRQTYEDIKSFNQKIVAALKQIDDSSLDDLEKSAKQFALFDARRNAEGSRGQSYGSDDMEQACDIAAFNQDILGGYEADRGRPKIFATDDDVLREANALYLNNTPLKWLDVGTRASALSFCATGQDLIKKVIGDPASNAVAKDMILLQNWWAERTSDLAAQKCSIYSAQDRQQIWDAFSADQQSNNDGSSSMEIYQGLLDTSKAGMTAQYRQTAQTALSQVFPNDAVLTSGQRTQVVTAVNSRTDFGDFLTVIPDLLDAAQKTANGPAARLWTSAIAANVTYIGGDYAAEQPVRADDANSIKSMFEEVKSWLAPQYRGYPIDIASLFEYIALDVDTSSNAYTDPGTAKITIGVGTRRSKAEYYSWLLHELRHAVMRAWHATAANKAGVQSDEGLALEGSGVASEALLLMPFLRSALKNDTAFALYVLDYGIRDARVAGTTDATLQKYLRTGCSGADDPDTVEFTKRIAVSYGLLGNKADTVAQRAHAGTQYLEYLWGGLYMLNEIAYLQGKVDPSGQHRIDPYVLFACGLNTPRRDQTYVDALKACMKL
jgi:hypothetical protein